ncbi:hypothetical protein MTO96_020581 [Rhipicephalus appendiculatus]
MKSSWSVSELFKIWRMACRGKERKRVRRASTWLTAMFRSGCFHHGRARDRAAAKPGSSPPDTADPFVAAERRCQVCERP